MKALIKRFAKVAKKKISIILFPTPPAVHYFPTVNVSLQAVFVLFV